jgi:hypothetical protein
MKYSVSGLIFTMLLIGGCVPTEAGPSDIEPTEPVEENEGTEETQEYTLLIFHNNLGPMCLEALDWLEEIEAQHPGLIVQEKLTFEEDDLKLLDEMRAEYPQSEGVSTSFDYLPIIFFRDRAFSGFNDDVASTISELLEGVPYQESSS